MPDMCSVRGGKGKTGHINAGYVPGQERKGENGAHKCRICARLGVERRNGAHKETICVHLGEEKQVKIMQIKYS
jgi:hypothetical protein